MKLKSEYVQCCGKDIKAEKWLKWTYIVICLQQAKLVFS